MDETPKKKAVALTYNSNLPAPLVAYKGREHLADAMVKIAKEHGIAVLKDAFLAENLYEIDIDQYIPEEYYKLVAEVLVFVRGISYAQQFKTRYET